MTQRRGSAGFDYLTELPGDPDGKLCMRRRRDRHWAGRDRAI